MQVLIVESNPDLAEVWKKHLERSGAAVRVATSQEAAIDTLQADIIDVIVLDLVLKDGSAFAIADFASYRRPDARVVFVTKSSFFSDGSIFNLIPNAAAFVDAGTPPDDIAAIVEHHGPDN
jgi:DNA-binding response OmpR family regulator